MEVEPALDPPALGAADFSGQDWLRTGTIGASQLGGAIQLVPDG
jgi:hypothetical protein